MRPALLLVAAVVLSTPQPAVASVSDSDGYWDDFTGWVTNKWHKLKAHFNSDKAWVVDQVCSEEVENAVKNFVNRTKAKLRSYCAEALERAGDEVQDAVQDPETFYDYVVMECYKHGQPEVDKAKKDADDEYMKDCRESLSNTTSKITSLFLEGKTMFLEWLDEHKDVTEKVEGYFDSAEERIKSITKTATDKVIADTTDKFSVGYYIHGPGKEWVSGILPFAGLAALLAGMFMVLKRSHRRVGAREAFETMIE